MGQGHATGRILPASQHLAKKKITTIFHHAPGDAERRRPLECLASSNQNGVPKQMTAGMRKLLSFLLVFASFEATVSLHRVREGSRTGGVRYSVL